MPSADAGDTKGGLTVRTRSQRCVPRARTSSATWLTRPGCSTPVAAITARREFARARGFPLHRRHSLQKAFLASYSASYRLMPKSRSSRSDIVLSSSDSAMRHRHNRSRPAARLSARPAAARTTHGLGWRVATPRCNPGSARRPSGDRMSRRAATSRMTRRIGSLRIPCSWPRQNGFRASCSAPQRLIPVSFGDLSGRVARRRRCSTRSIRTDRTRTASSTHALPAFRGAALRDADAAECGVGAPVMALTARRTAVGAARGRRRRLRAGRRCAGRWRRPRPRRRGPRRWRGSGPGSPPQGSPRRREASAP
jgi:hypothetical protein